jgi:four helix bundle protein
MFNFEKLDVYKEAVSFAKKIYRITKEFPKEELFGVTNQLRRTAISISLNIAEGSSRSKKEFKHFLNIAVGSVYECIPLIEISREEKYVSNKEYEDIYMECNKIAAMLNALKNSIKIPEL